MTAEPLLPGKVVLVSGGTQGVGFAVAKAAVAEGASSVVVTGRRADVGEAAAEELEELGASTLFVETDLRHVEQARASVTATIEEYGRVDCLVNAAGLTTRGSVVDSTPELFDDHVAVNLKSPFFLMQAAIHDMQRRGEPGTIVNVITMTSYGGQPYLAPYAASKAGLVGLTKNAAHAHRWDRIRVNGVNIGWTDTEGEDAIQRRFHGAGDDWRELAGKSLPMGRLGQADDIAALVVLLLSERSGVVTGSIVDWDQEVLGARD